MSYITEKSDSGSEYCETMDIADAELFANDNFRDYLLEYYLSMTFSKIPLLP